MIKDILNILESRYGRPKTELVYNSPFQLLVSVILSAQCTDKRVNIVTKELFKHLKDEYDFSKSSLKEIEGYIFSTGFYKVKAKYLLNLSKELKRLGKLPNTLEELIKLPGVGRKSANVFLAEIYTKEEGVIVDTHVKRVSFRIGLTKKKDPIQIERDLMKLLQKEDWILYSRLMVTHGRQICKPKPLCNSCPINQYCNYFKKLNKSN